VLALCSAFIAFALRKMPLPSKHDESAQPAVSPLGARHI